MSPRGLPLLGLALVGCSGEPVEAAWLDGFGFGWELFNHRVSALGFEAEPDAVRVMVVGGTSTTGLRNELPETCDVATCSEFPFKDFASTEIRWTRLSTSDLALGRAAVEVLASAAGDEATVSVPLSGAADGDLTALIAGWSLDTDHPLSGGDACYLPRNGWHPRRLGLEVVSVEAQGEAAEVTVRATFAAGNSLEEERQCVDAVADQALVPFTVQVVVLAGDHPVASHPVAHEQAYTYGAGPSNPDPQELPDPATRPLEVAAGTNALGWSRFDWRFHEDDPEGRGAYLRTLSLEASLGAGTASGHATNYSPVTQLSGFDYAFEGTVVAMELPGAVDRGRVEVALEELVDDQGDPLVIERPLQR